MDRRLRSALHDKADHHHRPPDFGYRRLQPTTCRRSITRRYRTRRTNRDLAQMASRGLFREDLFYRLSVVPIRVPSLRDRNDDIPALAEYSLAEFCARNNFKPKQFEVGVLELLSNYSWPGNVRELRNTIERMAILSGGDTLTINAIPVEIRSMPPAGLRSALHETRDAAERDRILQALDQTEWNVSAAARILNIERTNLHKRMRSLGLERKN